MTRRGSITLQDESYSLTHNPRLCGGLKGEEEEREGEEELASEKDADQDKLMAAGLFQVDYSKLDYCRPSQTQAHAGHDGTLPFQSTRHPGPQHVGLEPHLNPMS